MTAPPLPSSRILARGVQGFILFSLLGILLGVWWKKPSGLRTLSESFQWEFLIPVAFLVGCDFFLGGLRYRLFFNGTVLTRISLWNCIRAYWANHFVGAVTPWQIGSGPAQLYLFWRRGARISEGLSACLMVGAANLAFFLFSSSFILLARPSRFLETDFRVALQSCLAGLAGISLAFLVLFSLPEGSFKVLARVLDSAGESKYPRISSLRRLAARLILELPDFRNRFRRLLSDGKRTFLPLATATLLFFLNKCFIGYFLARSLAPPVPVADFLERQIFQLTLTFLSPTPGGSGVAEISSVWLMAEILPGNLVALYAVLWRVLTSILPVFLGGMVFWRDISKQSNT